MRGAVIFPGLAVPVAVGRAGSLRAIEAAIKSGGHVFAVAQRNTEDEISPEHLYANGVIARIGQVQRGLGGMQLLLQGEQRAHALKYDDSEGFLKAIAAPLAEVHPIDPANPAFAA